LLLLYISMATYTPMAMFYWVSVAVTLIFSYSYTVYRLKKWCYVFSLPFLAGGGYFVIAKILYVFQHIPADILGEHYVELRLNHALLGKDIKLLKNAVFAAFNLWNVIPSLDFVLCITLLIAIGLVGLLCSRSQSPGAAQKHRSGIGLPSSIFRCLAVIALLPLTIFPHLVSTSPFMSLRAISAMTALTVIMLFFSIRYLCFILLTVKKNEVVILILVILVMLSSHYARANIQKLMVLPAHEELKYIKATLGSADIYNTDRIVVIKPRSGNYLVQKHRLPIGGDEYGFLTSAHPQNIVGLVRCALGELGVGPRRIKDIEIATTSANPESLNNDKRTLVIDMNVVYNRMVETLDSFQLGR